MRLPDFIIGGAPRAGTTWLYELLDHHPDVHMAKPLNPEPKFFLRDDEYAKGLEYYSRKWFEDVEPSKVAGEKSTDYLERPAAREADLPVARTGLSSLLELPVVEDERPRDGRLRDGAQARGAAGARLARSAEVHASFLLF